MPHYKCQSCRTHLYSAAQTADLIDPRCPSCGGPSDHKRSARPRAYRPVPIATAASARHDRIVDRFAAFMARGRPDEVALLDAERWLDDGGSFDSEAVADALREPAGGQLGADADRPIAVPPARPETASLDDSVLASTRLELRT